MTPGETLSDVYDRRTPLYERYAHCTVDADGLTLEETVTAVLRSLPPHAPFISRAKV